VLFRSIPTTASEFEAMVIQDEIDLESYNLITRVDENNKILATPTYTPITLDNDYTAHNFGLEVFDGDLPPISSIEYPIDVVNQANTNTEKISEYEKTLDDHESRIATNEEDIDDIIDGTIALPYDNTDSEMTADTLQGAIDELDERLDTVESLSIPDDATDLNTNLILFQGSQTITEFAPNNQQYDFAVKVNSIVSKSIKITSNVGATLYTETIALNGAGTGAGTIHTITSTSSYLRVVHNLGADLVVTKIELITNIEDAINKSTPIESIGTFNQPILTISTTKKVTLPIDTRTSFLIWIGTQRIDDNDGWVDIAGTQNLIGLEYIRLGLAINSATINYEANITTMGTTIGIMDGDAFGDATNIRVNSTTGRIEMQVINETGATTLSIIRAYIVGA
jgi:hypothetical protein